MQTATGRRSCPSAQELDASGVTAQCAQCTADDPGRRLASDGLDDRDLRRVFCLYLAWFGADQVKIGITGQERGRTRLLEQGALLFTWLGAGTLLAARRLERNTVAAGLATERLAARAKHAGWWVDAAGAGDELQAVHTRLTEPGGPGWRPAGHPDDGVQPAPFELHDLRAGYGLGPGLARPRAEVTGLADGDLVTGRLDAVIGAEAIMTTPDGVLLLPLRLLAGWALSVGTSPGRAGADRRPRMRELPGSSRPTPPEPTLF